MRNAQVFFSDQDGIRYLHLDSPWVQGAMCIAQPFDLVLEYVQRMMAWLLFVPNLDTLSAMQTMQLGLGAGSLTKFCYKRLRTRTVAVEINPHVVRMCQAWFKLPPSNARLRILEGDAVYLIQKPQWIGCIDALQVDIYDASAAAPVLDSSAAYTHCHALLSAGGVMSVNLFGRDAAFAQSLKKIAAVFGENALWCFRPTREGNTIVLALREPQNPGWSTLRQRAQTIEKRFNLPAKKWIKALHPV